MPKNITQSYFDSSSSAGSDKNVTRTYFDSDEDNNQKQVCTKTGSSPKAKICTSSSSSSSSNSSSNIVCIKNNCSDNSCSDNSCDNYGTNSIYELDIDYSVSNMCDSIYDCPSEDCQNKFVNLNPHSKYIFLRQMFLPSVWDVSRPFKKCC